MDRLLTLLPTIALSALLSTSYAQESWKHDLGDARSFIENRGQFKVKDFDDFDNHVEYSYDGEGEDYFFTKDGLVFRFTQKSKHERTEEEKAQRNARKAEGFEDLKDWQLFERSGKKVDIVDDHVVARWVGANDNVEIIPMDKTDFYHSYSVYPDPNSLKMKNISPVPSYNKIMYRNIYDNIDVLYEFHPKGGIKYTVYVRPGGDVSDVKLRYSKDIELKPNGNIVTMTKFGEMIDHAPVSFYDSEKGRSIQSSYSVDGRVIGFQVAAYDKNETLVIDPWTQSPAFNTDWDCVWECETDAAGNAYIIGGTMPLQLLKYDAAGNLQWTYNTPYDTTMWLGTFATDDLGNSYVTNGSTAQIQMVSTAGALVWDNPSPGGLFTSTEFWNIAFNCDQTKLVIGGTGGSVPPLPYVYDIDMATGNVISSVQVTGSSLSPVQEVRAITATENEKYYWLTHDSIGYVDQDLNLCPNNAQPFHVENGGYGLNYKCENWRYNNTGIEAIAYYGGYVYTHRGDRLDKRDFATANIIQSATIPGGAFNSIFLGGNEVENSGIDIDDCGNIYVGATNGLVVFDQNLNQIGTYGTSFNVYDVDVSTGGDVIVAGSTGDANSSARTGSVQSFAVSACGQLATVCCNPSICPEGPLCTTDPAVTFQVGTAGGTWSTGPGFDPSTGTFDPAVAGPGTYTFYYTIACGMDSVTVTVGVCDPLEICVESNGDLTVSGGNPTYTWQEGTMTTPCISGLSNFCGFFTDPGTPAVAWTTIGTGPTITPGAGQDTLLVYDTFGDTVYVWDISTLPPCNAACDATIDPAGPFCETDAPVIMTAAQTGGTWSGTGITNGSTGEFDPATAGPGTHTITYSLGCGDTDTETITVNATDDPGFSYAQSSYCLSDPNPIPTITGLSGGTFTIDNGGTINSSTGELDITASGAGTFNITYTTNGPCPDNLTVTITLTTAADATISPAGPYCEDDASVLLTAVDPGGTWSGTGIINGSTGEFDPATAGPGTHTITYTISGSCGDTDTETITVNATDDPGFSYGQSSYCLTDPNPTPTITGLSGGTFTIDNGGTINSSTGELDITASGAGSFNITYTTNGPCPIDSTVTVTLTSGADATISAAGPFCEDDASVLLSAVDPGGTWSGTGIINASTGEFDPATAGPGTYTITYTISGSCGDTDTETITVNASDDPGFSFGQSSYCLTDPNPTPTVTGLSGGTFTIDNGGTINSSTGELDITASGAGTFNITYTTSGPCPTDSTVTVTLTSGADATISAAGPFCENDPSTNLTAVDGGGTWSGTGITDPNAGTFDPATAGPGTHTITYTISGGCGDTDTETITVNAADDPAFSYAQGSYCLTDPNPTPTVTGLSGGTFSIDNGGTINASTGEIDIATSGAGTYNIQYITNGPCPDSMTVQVILTAGGDATITPAGPFCENDPSTILNAVDGGGTWSGTGITNSTTGEFDPSTAGVGSWDIVYEIPGSCGDSDTITIVVNQVAIVSVSADSSICEGESVTLTASGTGSFLWSTGDTTSSITVSPSVSTTYYVDATTSCGTAADTATVTVTPNATASVSADTTILLGTSVDLSASGGTDYLWDPPTGLSCTTCPNPTASPSVTTTYCVDVSNGGSCVDTACVRVFVVDDCGEVFIPTAISPNDDGNNDVVRVMGNCVTDINLQIFNRWGELIFEGFDQSDVWDGTHNGKPVNSGVFVYYFTATSIVNGESIVKKGTITVIQ